MLPDIRAVIAAVFAAVGLLMASFGLVATFRVAHDSRADSLQADLAQRGRSAPPRAGGAAAAIIETSGPRAAKTETIAPAEPYPVAPVEVKDVSPPEPIAVVATEPAPAEPAAPVATATVDPPVGGPLPTETAEIEAEAARHAAEQAALKASRAAERRAARAARLERERKDAARRAAQARRAKQNASNTAQWGGTNFFTPPNTSTSPGGQ